MATAYWYNYYTFLVMEQQIPEVCTTPPPGCNLSITGYTSSGVTVKGDSDGRIYVAVSGWTGTTSNIVWLINGVTAHTGGNHYTFTGLTAGVYNIIVKQVSCFDSIQVDVIDGEFRTGQFNVSAPTGLTATENPIIISLSTAVNSPSPLVGESTFNITGDIYDGDSVTITLVYPQAYTAVFVAKNFPNKEDYFLTTLLKNGSGNNVGLNSHTEIATSLAEVFSQDLLLGRLYYFRASGTSVYAEAKVSNSQLNLVTGSTVTLVGSITCTETQVGISAFDGQIVANYSLYTDILVDETAQYGQTLNINTFNKVQQLELPFNQNNQHYFDISAVLKNYVSTSKIDFNVSGYTTLADMMAAYIVQYGEKYPLVINTSTKKSRIKGTLPAQYCINSALDWVQDNNMDAYLGQLVSSGSTLKTNIQFLTSQPNPKQVQRNSSEYLYLILPRDYGYPLRVKGDLYFYDGSQLLNQMLYNITTGTTNWGGVFAIAAGYNELNLASYEVLTGGSTRKIRKVDIAIWQTSGVTESKLTETLSYRYEIDEQPRRFGVAFLNKLGVWNIFDFTGEIVNSVSFSNESMEVPRGINLRGGSQEGFQANTVRDTRITHTIACNSGWIDLVHFEWLMELLGSNRIYNYTDVDSPFLIVENIDYKRSSNDDLYNIDVQFKETLQVNNISI